MGGERARKRDMDRDGEGEVEGEMDREREKERHILLGSEFHTHSEPLIMAARSKTHAHSISMGWKCVSACVP